MVLLASTKKNQFLQYNPTLPWSKRDRTLDKAMITQILLVLEFINLLLKGKYLPFRQYQEGLTWKLQSDDLSCLSDGKASKRSHPPSEPTKVEKSNFSDHRAKGELIISLPVHAEQTKSSRGSFLWVGELKEIISFGEKAFASDRSADRKSVV